MMDEEVRFRAAVLKAQDAVHAYALHMQMCGYRVSLPPVRLRKNRNNREGYGDDFDLSVYLNVEIKGRTFDFTCMEDFRYPGVVLDRKEKVERVSGLISAYIIVNASLTHACRVNVRTTQQYWYATTVGDDTKDGYAGQPVYMCPKEYCTFFKFRDAPVIGDDPDEECF